MKILKLFQYIKKRWTSWKEQRRKRKDWMWLGGKSAFKTTSEIISERFTGRF